MGMIDISEARDRDLVRRLREGVELLGSEEKALAAFRFANRAMAIQRVHSAFALQRRRGRVVDRFTSRGADDSDNQRGE